MRANIRAKLTNVTGSCWSVMREQAIKAGKLKSDLAIDFDTTARKVKAAADPKDAPFKSRCSRSYVHENESLPREYATYTDEELGSVQPEGYSVKSLVPREVNAWMKFEVRNDDESLYVDENGEPVPYGVTGEEIMPLWAWRSKVRRNRIPKKSKTLLSIPDETVHVVKQEDYPAVPGISKYSERGHRDIVPLRKYWQNKALANAVLDRMTDYDRVPSAHSNEVRRAKLRLEMANSPATAPMIVWKNDRSFDRIEPRHTRLVPPLSNRS